MPALLPTQTLPVLGHLLRYHVQGEGEDVVLLHGFPETLQGWDGHVQALARRFRVHAFDWLGLGGSDAPRGFDYSFQGYARLLGAVLDACGIEAANLVATDISVPPALLFALAQPERVKRLVVFDGPVFYRPRLHSWEIHALQTPPFGEIMVHLFPRTMTWIGLQRGFHDGVKITRDQYEDFQAQARRPASRRATLQLFRSSRPALEEIERSIQRLDHPMLILWGENDVFDRPEEGMLLKSACPHALLDIVPECGHFLHQEVPHYFDDQVSAFLSDRT